MVFLLKKEVDKILYFFYTNCITWCDTVDTVKGEFICFRLMPEVVDPYMSSLLSV